MDEEMMAVGKRAEAYADGMLEEYGGLIGKRDCVRLMLAAAWLEGNQAGASELRSMMLDRLAILGEHTS